jgi:hypothetical protein
MKVVPFVLLLALAGGCEIWDPRPGLNDFLWGLGDESVPDPTLDIRKKEYPSWPKETREAVDGRVVLVGMTKNQALVALRLAEKEIAKQVVETTAGTVESWCVWKVANGWAYWKMRYSQMVTISFSGGKVVQLEFHSDTKGLSPVMPHKPPSPIR